MEQQKLAEKALKAFLKGLQPCVDRKLGAAYRLSLDEYNGRQRLQMIVEAAEATADPVVTAVD